MKVEEIMSVFIDRNGSPQEWAKFVTVAADHMYNLLKIAEDVKKRDEGIRNNHYLETLEET